jgi:tRNA modification GTPase
MDHSKTGPIIACATGESTTSAISVIRISGFEKILDFDPFFTLAIDKIKPRYTHHTKLIHPKNGALIDDIIVTFFQAPNSYNGENILEISCHGNPFIIKNIINLFTEFTAIRQAGAGEFTLRALENKKLSLSQVEGLDLILNSQSNYGINEGLKSLCGELHQAYLELEQLTLKLCSALELGIDFIDDVGEESFQNEKDRAISKLANFLEQLYLRACSDYSPLLSPEIVLFGPVNAGKSSLFNQCLKTNRSIVSNIAGTTRDFISEYLNINGHHFKLIDTAGFREVDEEIESEGIKRSLDLVNKAFYKVLVINPSMDNFHEEFSTAKDYDICLLSHSDGADFASNVLTHCALFKNKPIFMADLTSFGPIEPTSFGPIEPASFGPIEPLPLDFQLLQRLVYDKYLNLQSKNPIILPRHRELIARIYTDFSQFQILEQDENDIAIISNELNLLCHKIQLLIGSFTQNQVLRNVFDNFCIGK